MKQWYTLYTKPNSEYQVAAALGERGVETYLPELEVPQPRPGRSSEPYFPCYLFAKIDLQTVGLSQVQWTPGLRRLVVFDEQPVALPDEIIDLIRRKLEAIEIAGGWRAHPFRPGDSVRIIDGPFQDMLAIFEGPTTPAERVQVLLNILGASRVQVAVTDLEKAIPTENIAQPVSKRPRRTRGRGRRIQG